MNIIVVGGGVAGWLTAIYLKTQYKFQVTLIQSKKIGTIGVGEGTVPLFLHFLTKVGINLKDFYNKVPTTKKFGINFVNFNKAKTQYNHDFDLSGNEQTKAIHFDSSKLLDYLLAYGKSTGIKHIIDEVENHQLEKYDFIFDCTGFRRSILKQNWVDCSKWLPFNSAIPFTLPPINKERTQSIATDKGWIWQIPLPARTGCGYVYNNNINTQEEIIKHIKELYPSSEVNRSTISFSPGYQNNVWVDNCIAVGLSSTFFEPIEATSLMVVILQLYSLPLELTPEYQKKYNSEIRDYNEEIMLFIRLHYLCDRKDGNWEYINNIPLPPKLKSILNKKNQLNVFRDQDLWSKLNYGNPSFSIGMYQVFSNNNFTPLINSLI